MMNRRQLLIASGLSIVGLRSARAQNILGRSADRTITVHQERFVQEILRIEAASGGRLGVAVLDTQDGAPYRHRSEERFPMCSTFKLLAAAHVLARVDRKQERLDRLVPVRVADLVDYSPSTKPRAGGAPMSMAELCDAAVTLSDNTAANLMLSTLGGPAGLTAWLRTLGDARTRLDRNEPTLNTARPGDPRDTTTPAAMLATMRKLLLGDALSSASRTQLTQWLVDNKTGGTRLRAGLPPAWKVGDKTGSGANGTNNDVGIIWPTGRAPVLVTAYLTGSKQPAEVRERTLAAVGKLVADLVGAQAG
jgi:beta-lactamase class A